MVEPQELYSMLQRRPFQPFRVHLKDGRMFEIQFPEINMVGTSYIIIGVPVPNDPDPIAERSIKIPLLLINRIEPLTPTPSTMTD